MFTELKHIAQLAEEAASKMGLGVVISIVDIHGNAALLHRMDKAPMHSLEMAFRKAYTAATFNVATQDLTEKVQPNAPLFGLAVNSGSKLIAFGGGAPFIVSTGERFGIGISGGTTEEDIDIMLDAISTFNKC